VNDFDHKNGEDETRRLDLSRPQEGEPAPEGDVNVDTAAADDGQVKPAFDEPVEVVKEEAPPDTGAPPPESSETTLPLPLLEELAHEPPVKQPPPPPEEPAAHVAEAEEESGRRLSEPWRIDLKWIFGIPATVILILTLAAFVLFRVSDEETATAIIEATRDQVMDSRSFSDELGQLDPEVLSLLESDTFVSLIYEDPAVLDEAIDAIPEFEEDDPRASRFDYVRTTLNIFDTMTEVIDKDMHLRMRSALIILLLLLALFGIPYVIFSRRLGKIVSVAVSLALASWIPFLTLLYLRGNLSDWIAESAGAAEAYQTQVILGMADTFSRELIDNALPAYRFFSLAALILLGFGLIGLLVVWWRYDESMMPRKKKLRG
jgi:hypothetical protein